MKKELTKETKIKISKALKGKKKPTRSKQHRDNLSIAFKNKSYEERYGKNRSILVKEKISKSNLGKIRIFKNKEEWRKNLSDSLKGRKVWNKGKKGVQKAWNKLTLPEKEIIDLYLNKNFSSSKIANKYNVSKSVILRILKDKDIKLKGIKHYTKGKTYEEMYGTKNAKKIKQRLSKSLKGHPVKNWAHKISKGIRKHYEECRKNNIRIYRVGTARTPEQRLKLSIAKKRDLREHPEELERLKKIQYLGGITKVEQKMLQFLKKNFKEERDFFFDKQDKTGKTLYRPDFQFPNKKSIIEVDGYYKHFTKEGYKKDKIREYYLKKAGWKIYRFNFYSIDRQYKFKEVKKQLLKILDVKC